MTSQGLLRSVSVLNGDFASARPTTRQLCEMQSKDIGELRSVLVGHTGVVTYVDFSPTHPHALLSSSVDGTCRVWDATSSGVAPRVLSATSRAAFATNTIDAIQPAAVGIAAATRAAAAAASADVVGSSMSAHTEAQEDEAAVQVTVVTALAKVHLLHLQSNPLFGFRQANGFRRVGFFFLQKYL